MEHPEQMQVRGASNQTALLRPSTDHMWSASIEIWGLMQGIVHEKEDEQHKRDFFSLYNQIRLFPFPPKVSCRFIFFPPNRRFKFSSPRTWILHLSSKISSSNFLISGPTPLPPS